MKVNFGGISESKGSSGVPAGTYTCMVQDAEFRNVEDADKNTSLNFSLRIVEGEYEGQIAAFDSLYFHQTAGKNPNSLLERAKYILRRMGVTIPDGDNVEIDVEPEQINKALVVVTTQPDPKCPECNWSIENTGKDAEGNILAKCKSDRGCTWEGYAKDAKQYTRPRWTGYEMLDPKDVSAEIKASAAKVQDAAKEVEKLKF